MKTEEKLCTCNEKPFYPAKVRATVNSFERIISFKPGFVCENDFREGLNRGKSHGLHGMDLIFILKGELGAIQFILYTGWVPNWKEYEEIKHFMPCDIGFHSYKPQYEGQTKQEKCCWLNDADCYYDGSGLQAVEVFKLFISKGEEALWDEMESYYKTWLDKPSSLSPQKKESHE